MALSAKNRKKVEELIYSTLDKLEPGGMNSAKYKATFSKMSDKEFLAFFQKMKDNDDAHLYVENDLYGKNEITMKSIKAAAKHINIPLEEYVYMRHKTEDGNVVRSAYKIPVMYIHMKRMQQLLSKKVKTNVDIESGNVRSKITGSLSSSEKSGRFTDMDTQSLISVTSDTHIGKVAGNTDDMYLSYVVTEVLGFRGDNNAARMLMSQNIATLGKVSQNEIVTYAKASGAPLDMVGQGSKALDIFYLGAGLKSNISSPIGFVNKKAIS